VAACQKIRRRRRRDRRGAGFYNNVDVGHAARLCRFKDIIVLLSEGKMKV